MIELDDLPREYSRALRGDLTGLMSLTPLLKRDERPESRAWVQLTSSMLSLFTPHTGMAVDDIKWIADTGSAEARRLGDLLCRYQELRCVLWFDREELGGWRDVHRRIHSASGGSRVELGLVAVDCWMALLDGQADRTAKWANALSSQAAKQGDAASVLESMVLRSLSALALGKLDEALQTARQGSRMASTEELILHEYLVNIVLARVRRYTGKPHLSQRILDALARVTPRPWLGWITWELLFASSYDRAAELLEAYEMDHAAPAFPSQQALRMFRSAQEGDHRAFEETVGFFEQSTSLWKGMADEALVVAAALSPARAVGAPVAEWRKGLTDVVPGVLRGLTTPRIALDGTEQSALVVFTDGRQCCRMLSRGIGLLPDEARAQLVTSSLSMYRVYTALAILALVGPEGLEERDLFQAVYGFPYEPTTHSAVLRTLLYRMRSETAETALIERIDDRLVLRPLGVFLVPDPRATADLEDLILQTLAHFGGKASAKQTASALNVPIRTVQAAFKRLIGDGACEVERTGRNIEYSLEDTTFYQPTLKRLKPRI